MADNVPITAGAGTNIAADDVGGVYYQRVKLATGADGVATDVSVASPLPVEIQGSIPVTIASAIEITNDAGNAIPVSGTVSVDNFPATQAVSAASLPLPTGAATEVTLADIQAQITTLASTIYNHNAPFTDGLAGQLILGKRRDSDSTAVADGDLNTFNMDEEGRLKVSSKPASYPDITGDITAVQASISVPVAGGTVAGDVSRASNIMIFCTGTFSTVNCTFEGSLEASGDTNWFGVQVVRSNANTIETTTGNLSAQPAYAWEASVNALKRFRVRCTARTSGTQSWRFVQGTYATEPIPAAQVSGTQPVSGTVTANLGAATTRAGFFAAHGFWYDDSSTNLAAGATFTGTSRDLFAAATGTAWATATVQGKEVRVSAESDVTGTLWIETSRDNTNWRRVKSVATTAVTGGGFFAEIVHRPSWRYLRVGYTNGAGAQARFTINSATVGN